MSRCPASYRGLTSKTTQVGIILLREKKPGKNSLTYLRKEKQESKDIV